MKRFAIPFIAFIFLAGQAQAHFLWLVADKPVDDNEKNPTILVFNDDFTPGEAAVLKKIDMAKVYARNLKLETSELKLTDNDKSKRVGVPDKGPQVIAAVCRYGVYQKDKEDPVLVNYYAKTYVGEDLKKAPPDNLIKPWDKLALEIVPLPLPEKNVVQVLWQGKPAAGVEVFLYVPGWDKKEEGITAKGLTDNDGKFQVKVPKDNGVYGIRVVFTEKTPGEVDGQKYTAIRHHATLTFPVRAFKEQ
jgi:uncharacterized GH25 family protein